MKFGEYEDSYFIDEVRDGYLVPSMMKRLWAMNLKVYNTLSEVCEKHGVECTAMWGTLVGAIRNGGYIPWDDDIDLGMIRSDYQEIENAEKAGEFPGEYWIRDYEFTETENIVKNIMSTKSLVEKYEVWGDNYGFPFAGIIDIFVQDYIPIEGEESEKYWHLIEKMGEIRQREKTRNKKAFDMEFERDLKALSKELSIKFDKTSKTSLFVQLMKAMDEFCARYDENSSNWIGIPSYYLASNRNMYMSKHLYAHYIDVKFECSNMRVPAGYDGILRRTYGDYMIPHLQYGAHGYPVYENMNKDAKQVAGFELTGYHYDSSAVETIRGKRTPKAGLKDSLFESLKLLKEAHAYMMGPDALSESAVIDDLCGQCQELAIQVGESIENRAVDGESIVRPFEEYCEYLYGIHTCDDASEKVRLCGGLSDHEKRIENAINSVSELRQVVFILYRSDDLPAVYSLWKAVSGTPGWKAVVIAVPYYMKDAYQQIDKESFVLETEGFLDDIMLTDYNSYDFEANHPNIIVHTHPYDEYNGALSIHPFFYMQNLYQYTDRLVLIPTFKHREASQGDRVRYVLRTYLETPGAVIADNICVQSDDMKRACAGIMSEIKGTSVESELARFISVGLPLDDYSSMKNAEKGSSDSGSTSQLKLLYMPGGSVIYEYGERALNKIKSFLNGMEEYGEDVRILWCEDPYICDILSEPCPELWKSYNEIKDEYVKKPFIEYIEPDDDIDRVVMCDGMYGDGCVWMNEFREKNKPVLWATPWVEPYTRPVSENPDIIVWTPDMTIAIESEGQGWNVGKLLAAMKNRKDKKQEPTRHGEMIWKRLTTVRRGIAVVYNRVVDSESGNKTVQALNSLDKYEVYDCPLDEGHTIQSYYVGWDEVDLVITINLAGFEWRSSGDNSMYATLAINAFHIINREVDNEARLLSGLIPITMKFITDTKERLDRIRSDYRRIHDGCYMESVEGIGDLLENLDWRRAR